MKDFKLSENLDLVIEDGDLAIADCDADDIQLIIASAPGDFKQYPELGANAIIDINTTDIYALKLRIEKHLRSDGFNVKQVTITNEGVIIDANK